MKRPAARVLSGKLDPTATYAARRWKWVACPQLTVAGLLEIVQVFRRRRDFESDLYLVEDAGQVPGGRLLRLLNSTDESQEDVYECVVGITPQCSCKAGRTRTPVCKHRDACAALLAAGGL